MAEATTKVLSLAEQYVLDKVKPDAGPEPVEPTKVENPQSPPPVEEKIEENAAIEETTEVPKVKPDAGPEPVEPTKVENPQIPPPVEEKIEENAATEETTEVPPVASAESTEETNNVVEEIPEAEPENTSETSKEEEAPTDEEPEEKEIVLSTAPADYRFPTTNQSRHCFTRYIEYHRCVAAKGEGASDCDKFAKYYRALCPGEWVDRWNEQRENGTFPGPL